LTILLITYWHSTSKVAPSQSLDTRAFGVPYFGGVSTTTRQSSSSVEDYTKAIYSLQELEDVPVTTTAVAHRLAVTPGSASAMLKKLAELGLVTHTPYRGVRLTPEGRQVALEMVRHHRLIELFLAEVLGMSWDRVHAEAEVLEHVISEELEALIAAKLGDPTLDPHGSPIPTEDFAIPAQATRSLEELAPGDRGRLVRVSDANPAMLRYLAELGIAPGDEFEVVARQPFGGPLTLRFADRTEAIGGELAKAMFVGA